MDEASEQQGEMVPQEGSGPPRGSNAAFEAEPTIEHGQEDAPIGSGVGSSTGASSPIEASWSAPGPSGDPTQDPAATRKEMYWGGPGEQGRGNAQERAQDSGYWGSTPAGSSGSREGWGATSGPSSWGSYGGSHYGSFGGSGYGGFGRPGYGGAGGSGYGSSGGSSSWGAPSSAPSETQQGSSGPRDPSQGWGHQPYPTGPQGAYGAPHGVAQGSRTRSGWWVFLVVLLAAVVGAGAGAGVNYALPRKKTVVEQVAPGPAMLTQSVSIPSILAKVQPAVVSIKATAPETASVIGPGLPGIVEDEGTGMIISKSGLILTNNHVIVGSTEVRVTLYGQTKSLGATVVGTDPTDDIAVLRINHPPSSLHTVHFGNSSLVKVGDAVVAIGNALGLGGALTVTQGIISAEGRTITAVIPNTNGKQETLTNMLQTDAAINPGNSGGPLVDSAGQVIGMNTAVASSSGNNAPAQNIGFAIPINKVRHLLPAIESGKLGKPSGGFLGVYVASLTPSIRAAYGISATYGALVVGVIPDSPAVKAGIEPGDVIIAVNSHKVTDDASLELALRADHAGQSVTVTVIQAGAKLVLHAVLSQPPAA